MRVKQAALFFPKKTRAARHFGRELWLRYSEICGQTLSKLQLCRAWLAVACVIGLGDKSRLPVGTRDRLGAGQCKVLVP